MQDLSANEVSLLCRVLERLSSSLEEERVRQSACEDLMALLQADYAASFVWNESAEVFQRAVYLNMSPDNLARYEAHYQFHDPITPALQRRRHATLVVEVMPQEELERTEFFNDFLQRDGLHHGINVYAYDGDLNIGDLRIWRAAHRPDFTVRDKDLLEAVRPHFTNALRNARVWAEAQDTARQWADLWESAPGACFVYDSHEKLVHQNRAARRLESDLADPERTTLMTRVGRLLRGDLSQTRWGPYFLSVLRDDEPGTGRPLIVVQAYQRPAARLDAAYLRQEHGLSPREAEVCLLAAKGLTDGEIARVLGVSFHTVRTYLNNSFLKLDVTNRTELVHAVLSGLVEVAF
ncbi:MAG: helix-turn-helix transcriptional regulator [Proteobacteria bacterium]|nr:helix-turn-helix transcriptional regulator [Pseudomonadota bacterium]MBU1740569.1 helix-turn-helix transcriptional regulator [Pseudomonadota bacterium]